MFLFVILHIVYYYSIVPEVRSLIHFILFQFIFFECVVKFEVLKRLKSVSTSYYSSIIFLTSRTVFMNASIGAILGGSTC